MPLENHKQPYVYCRLPSGWATPIASHVFSRSNSTHILYRTPKFTGLVIWHDDQYIYGSLAAAFEWEGKLLHACDGECLRKRLNIPVDYCTRTGKDGWMILLQRHMFEMWLTEGVELNPIEPLKTRLTFSSPYDSVSEILDEGWGVAKGGGQDGR